MSSSSKLVTSKLLKECGPYYCMSACRVSKFIITMGSSCCKRGTCKAVCDYNKLNLSISFRSWTMSINLCPVFKSSVIEVNGNITLVASLGSAPKERRSGKPQMRITSECTIPHVPHDELLWGHSHTNWHAALVEDDLRKGYSYLKLYLLVCQIWSDVLHNWETTNSSDRPITHCSKITMYQHLNKG